VRVVHYVTPGGVDYFGDWFRNQDCEVRARIQVRIDRIEVGNLGDHRGLGGGVSERRISLGPGYRAYYGRDGDDMAVLLGGGTKSRQSKDIARAKALWNGYLQEKRDAC
jgi:putative addiction module killer protein